VTPLQNALFQHELSRHVRADDEAQALEPARLRDDVAHDPDDFALHVEHRAARVALVDRRVRLEELGERHLGEDRVGLVAGAQVPDGQRVGDPVGSADDDDLLADLHPAGVAQSGRLYPVGDMVRLEPREVGAGLRGDHPRCRALAACELDDHLVGDLYDMGCRQHLAVSGYEDPRAHLVVLHEHRGATLGAQITSLGSDDHHRSGDALEDLRHALCLAGGRRPGKGTAGK